VCAKDQAGLWACAEDSVGVPLTAAKLKHIVPENNGKLFIVAEDHGFFDATPDELGYRPENFDQLNAPVPAAFILCNSNYGMNGGTSTSADANTVEECALLCMDTCEVRLLCVPCKPPPRAMYISGTGRGPGLVRTKPHHHNSTKQIPWPS